ncbi:MAG: hypothetical protein QOE70_3683 [Chthoniobacter sp.]|jgi:hypothetical protein|nr:hypothetical protein [Chthoniobacter sp.]
MWDLKKIDWEEYYATVPELLGRLLDTKTSTVERTVERARSEYDKKWSEKRAEVEKDPDGFRHRLLYPLPGARVMFSMRDELFEGDLLHRHAIKDGLVNNVIARTGKGPVCVLGAGFGETTTRLVTSRPKYGGELTAPGVGSCRALGLDVSPFNYCSPADYQLIRPSSTILTVHSLEQIPDANHFLEGMRTVRERVEFAVHLEPTRLSARAGLIGFLRNRYMEVNDYSLNLHDVLASAADVEILDFQPDVFGQVPFNSASLIVWRFRS